jgi:ATP-binding cassette subfamily G (WHITE) protein 2 (SNQ2)
VSGGEKKRVTIGEMLVGSRAQLFVFDQFTKGLDSAVSLDIVRSMRRSVDRDKRVFIVSMQQPSEDIYWLFDRVLVLDQGKELFFGRVSEAVPYFESIGIGKPLRRSIPEFLCSVSDPKHTLIRPGFEDVAPTDVASFERRYKDSIYHKKVLAGLSNGYADRDISRRRPIAQDISHLLERRVLQPFHTQLKLCVQRQFRMDLNNRGTLLFRFCRYIFMGLVLGALFFKEQRDKQGSLALVGALFISLMQMGLGSISTLPNIFEQRAVLYKQTSSNFILPQPFFIAQMIEEAPVYFLEVVLYSSSLYWMSGMNPMNDGQRFLFFIFVYWILDLVMSAQTRLIAVGTPAVEVATAISPAVVITNVVFAGFILPRGSIPPWWIWLYYLSPFHYTFVSAMINQFDGLKLFCTRSELEPKVSYIPYAFRTCPVSTGAEYIRRQFQINHPYGWKFYNVLILVGFYTLYSVLGLLCVTFLKFSPRRGGKRSISKRRSSTEVNRELDEELRVFRERYESTLNMDQVSRSIYFVTNENDEQERSNFEVSKASSSFSKAREEHSFSGADVLQSDEHLSLKEVYFTWKHLYYIIPKENQKKGLKKRLLSKKSDVSENDLVLLNDVTGYAVPGRLVALMGSSGAGKTTLLDVLARRKTFGKILGSIELNREPVHISFRRINGYVEQEDIHVAQQTIREAITFSAMLRLPAEVPKEKKILAVERILDILELRDVENRLVGFGLPPETKKRVTIGVELVVNPLVLFLDEPTSGLDARAALVVMRAIRRVAHAGHTVVCTIHQPSTEIFEMFDDLLLLQRGGHVVYFGPLGIHSKIMIDYFVRNGAQPIQQGRNPADWMLEVVGAGISGSQTVDWASVWKNSPEYRTVLASLGEIDNNNSQLDEEERNRLENVSPVVPENLPKVTFRSSVASTFREQVVQVTKRIFICYWRFPSYNWTRFVIAIVMSLLIGSAFYKFPHNQQGARNSIAVLYMGAMYGVMQQTSSINPMFQMRDAFYREVAAGTYYPVVYWIAIGLVEMPFSLVPGTIYVLILYFLAGFPASKFGFFYFNFFIFMWSAISLGQTVATFSPNPMVAYMLNPVLNSLQSALAGFVIPEPSIPVYFKWLYWIDPYRYLLEAISTNTIENFSYYCTPSEYRYFTKPASWPSCEVNSNNQSTPYVSAPVGLCSAVTVNGHTYDKCCRYCPITRGSQVLSEFGLQYWRRWDDLGALVGFWWIFRFATLFGLQFVRWVQR